MSRRKLITHEDVRRYLANCIYKYDKGEMDSRKLRDMTYSLHALATIIKDEKITDIEKRLEQIETGNTNGGEKYGIYEP